MSVEVSCAIDAHEGLARVRLCKDCRYLRRAYGRTVALAQLRLAGLVFAISSPGPPDGFL